MAKKLTTVLVLGASGMLGSTALRFFAQSAGYAVWGSTRSSATVCALPASVRDRIVSDVDVDNVDSLARLFAQTRPDVVVNCVGFVRPHAEVTDPLQAIPLNTLLPHRLARLCQVAGSRLVHVSTDGVFSGERGHYREEDMADAQDLYGRSKHLGEVDYPHAVTLRTSIVGPEIGHPHGLLSWFLGQTGEVRGYTRAVFSGLPTVELAHVIRDHVLTHENIHGLYHVAAEPISKYDLLQLIAREYGKHIAIVADETLVIDRSLDSSRFRQATGYVSPPWPDLVRNMRLFG